MSEDNKKYLPEKPDDVSWGDWVGPKKLSHRHHFIVHLAALGMSQGEICRRTGIVSSRMSILMNNSKFIEEITKVRKEIFSDNLDQNLKLMLPKATEVIRNVLENDQARDALRVETAFRLMDRTHGKAMQKIEVGGSMIKSLFEQLDAMKEVPADVTPDYEDAEIIKDTEINDWIDKNIEGSVK